MSMSLKMLFPSQLDVVSNHVSANFYLFIYRWWRRPNCPDPRSNAKSKAIEIEVASGMFIVLLSGIALSTIVCVIQYLIKKKCAKCVSIIHSHLGQFVNYCFQSTYSQIVQTQNGNNLSKLIYFDLMKYRIGRFCERIRLGK